MNNTLSVAAIQEGTVIDHIPPGQAFRLVHLLSLQNSQDKVTIGLRLPSKRLGLKDLIKIENRILTDEEANEIVVFAPLATIKIIKESKVVKKLLTRLPDTMKRVFVCGNPMCITQTEEVVSYFSICEEGKQIKLTCRYCEKRFDRDEVRVSI